MTFQKNKFSSLLTSKLPRYALAAVCVLATSLHHPAIALENTQDKQKVGLGAVDFADALTTAAGLAVIDTVTEANPVVGVFGDSAAPVTSLAIKFGIKKLMVHSGYSVCTADKKVGIGSAFGACNNIAVIAGATGAAGPVVGLACAVAYYKVKTCEPQEVLLVDGEVYEVHKAEPVAPVQSAPDQSKSWHQTDIYGGR